MKNGIAVLAVAALACGLAAPASATVTKYVVHVGWNRGNNSSDAAKPTSDLDCSTATAKGDGADIDASDMTITSDATGGCKFVLKIDNSVKTVEFNVSDAAGKAHTYSRTLATSDAMPGHTIELER